jgi:hypothetical protein
MKYQNINEIISIINNENNIINNVEIISIMKENNENGMKIMAYQYNNENAIINNGEEIINNNTMKYVANNGNQ